MQTVNGEPSPASVWTLSAALKEIGRLRARLDKIAHAPVAEGNEIALQLKRLAMWREGEDV